MTIKAVLGPTNTGKTHLAIERMCGHSSGMMGFPLRLLAREVYDRVRAIKGDKQVALITGEERIEPRDARYFCCTVEAMPRDIGKHAFLALDEAQLAAERAQATSQLTRQVGEVAVALAGKVVGQSLTDDARVKSTVDSFLADLESQVAQRGAGA